MNVFPVSVLMCTHNGARFVGDQIDSILESSYPLLNIFVFDWASTDETIAILRSYQLLDNRLIIFEKNFAPGPAKSFLLALNQVAQLGCDWEYLALCDQDDIWCDDKIELQVSSLSSNSRVAISYTDVEPISAEGLPLGSVADHFGKKSYYKCSLSRKLDASIFFSNPAVGMTMLLRRDFVEFVNKLELSRCIVMHDWLLMQIAYIFNYETLSLDYKSVKYRQHDNNILGGQVNKGIFVKFQRARALVSNSFLQIRIWNLVLSPSQNLHFSFFQIIKSLIFSNFLSPKGKTVLSLTYSLLYFKRSNDV